MVEGPLDIVRRIGSEAEELDEFAMNEPELTQSELYPDFIQTVFERDKFHPLMGERVVVYGRPLTFSVELEEETGDLITRPLAVAAEEEYRPSSGIYSGLTLLCPYDAAQEQTVYRIAHTVETGSSDLYPDEYGNLSQTHYREYILAKGSEVVPYNPVNAHSFIDLHEDPVTRAIDELAFNDATNNGNWPKKWACLWPQP